MTFQKIRTLSFVLITFFLCFGCKVQGKYSGTKQGKNEKNKCYSMCMMPDTYKVASRAFCIYTGDRSILQSEDPKLKQVFTRPASTKWVQKKEKGECPPSDPNDCMVWCLAEVPATIDTMFVIQEATLVKKYEKNIPITENVLIVKDTSVIKDFVVKEYKVKALKTPGGFTEYKEMLCAHKQTPEIINQIQEILKKRNYYKGESTSILDAKTKTALTKLQKDNGLAMGYLTIETIKFLEIEL